MKTDKCKYGCRNGKIFMPSMGTFVDCPEHAVKNLDMNTYEVDEDLSIGDALMIPEQYRGLGAVDRALFTREIVEDYTVNSITYMGNLLEKINKNLYNGSVLKLSCYIHAPSKVDIKHFVYGSQKLALEKGLSTVPFISANTLYGVQSMGDFSLGVLDNVDKLLTINRSKSFNGLGEDVLKLVNYTNEMTIKEAVEKAEQKLRVISTEAIQAVEGYRHLNETGLTYSDYIKADLCFIDMTANTKGFGFTAVADILNERSKRNLPTYVIGYWGSKSGKTAETLKFLLANGDTTRLDLLVPFDLQYKTVKEKVDIKPNIENIGSTKSNVTGGYSL